MTVTRRQNASDAVLFSNKYCFDIVTLSPDHSLVLVFRYLGNAVSRDRGLSRIPSLYSAKFPSVFMFFRVVTYTILLLQFSRTLGELCSVAMAFSGHLHFCSTKFRSVLYCTSASHFLWLDSSSLFHHNIDK